MSRFAVSIPTALLALLLGLSPLPAQTPRPNPSPIQSWTERELYTPETPFPSQHRATLEAPGKRTRSVLLPEGTMDSHYLDGWIHALVKDQDGRQFRFLRSKGGENWERIGVLPYADILPAIPLQFLPLRNGRLLLRTYLPLNHRGQTSVLGIFRPDAKGGLELVDLVVDETMQALTLPIQATGPDGKPRPAGAFQQAFNTRLMLPYSFELVATRDAFVMVSTPLGHLLAMDPQDGHLLRSRDVYGYGEPRALKSLDGLEHCVLGVQPRPNGHLLLATRSEDAFLNARKIFGPRAMTTVELAAFREKRTEGLAAYVDALKHSAGEAMKAFPEVFYWDFDPYTGDLIRQPTPSGMPGSLLAPEMLSSFTLRMTADGRPALPQRVGGSL